MLGWLANTDADLQGYRVFKANSPTEEFIEVIQHILREPTFTDTVNIQTLTKHIYYKVIAVDRNFNTSDYSPHLALKRPDVITPAAPVFTRAERKGETIELEWVGSVSEDVVRYELYRQDKESGVSMGIGEWASKEAPTRYTDARGKLGKTYRYSLRVYDEAGNETKVASKEIFFETGVRKPVSEIKATVDREQKKVVLQWNYEESNISKCVIYRAREGQSLRLYQTLEQNPGKFEDNDLSVNNKYTYKIKVFFNNGLQSLLSDGVLVSY